MQFFPMSKEMIHYSLSAKCITLTGERRVRKCEKLIQKSNRDRKNDWNEVENSISNVFCVEQRRKDSSAQSTWLINVISNKSPRLISGQRITTFCLYHWVSQVWFRTQTSDSVEKREYSKVCLSFYSVVRRMARILSAQNWSSREGVGNWP